MNLFYYLGTRVGRATALAGALALVSVAPAKAVELLSNGDFETGTLAGWTVTDLAGGSGSFFAMANGGSPPLSSLGPTASNPVGGTTHAVSDQTGPGTHALTQSFMIPFGASMTVLSFDMFMDDYSGANPTVDPSGLDHTTGGTFATNQHARIEILTAGAAALSTAPVDIVASILVPVPAPAFPSPGNPWIPSPLFDLTPFVMPGGTYQVRFAEVDNSGNLILGVDNVSIMATTVPAPGSLALLALGLGGLAVRRRTRLR